jgi:hypothetical protein
VKVEKKIKGRGRKKELLEIQRREGEVTEEQKKKEEKKGKRTKTEREK